MLEFERVDVPFSIHGVEVRYIVSSEEGKITGHVIANRYNVEVTGRFPALQACDVRALQSVLRKACRIHTALKFQVWQELPSESELDRILEEERSPERLIADSDWRARDEEVSDPFEPGHTLDEYTGVQRDEGDG